MVDLADGGVLGESVTGEGVRGVSHSAHGGVVGINDSDYPSDLRLAPVSIFDDSRAIRGGPGGWFESNQGEGVRGWSKNPHHGGVVGVNTAGGIAVYGTSDNGVGVSGTSVNAEGIIANTNSLVTAAIAAYNSNNGATGAAVYAKCVNSEAIHAVTNSLNKAAIAAYQMNESSDSAALYAKHNGNKNAAVFEGNLVVTGNIDITGLGSDIRLTNADCAEDFDVCGANNVEPGTVMVLGDEGALFVSQQAYDRRAAGVISGAGDYKPGIVLDVHKTSGNRQPIALMGKVFCKVDAQFGAIQVGDLLTTSPTPGHAMVASEPAQAFGSIIGKALRSLSSGKDLIPILVALQ